MKLCNQVCRWNTYTDGCTRPFEAICPPSNTRLPDVPDTDVVKTNAYHIRSMTDEELAEWMEAHNVSCGIFSEYVACGGEVVFGDNTCDCDCATHYLNWLRQPYKEATDD